MYISENDYLMHYGVKGMKWGVRRYQNYDGSYTRNGLKRYKEAESQYESARSDLKNAKASRASKNEINSKKRAVKQKKTLLDRSYKKLKLDNRADEGKKLYQQGKTIDEIHSKSKKIQYGVIAGGTVATQLLRKFAPKKYAVAINAGIGIGTVAFNSAVSFVEKQQTKKLRAYYGH